MVTKRAPNNREMKEKICQIPIRPTVVQLYNCVKPIIVLLKQWMGAQSTTTSKSVGEPD